MSKPRTSALAIPAALVAAIAVTLLSVWLLSMLNAQAMPDSPAPTPIRTVMVRSNSPESVRRPQRPQQSDPPPPPPQEMTVTLEKPVLEPLPMPPLELNLDLPEPEVEQVEVAIFQPPVQPPDVKPLEMNVAKATTSLTARRKIEMVTPPRTTPVPKATSRRVERSTTNLPRSATTVARSHSSAAASTPTTAARVGPRVHRADKVDQPPREAFGNAEPAYPIRERNLGIEGTVLVRLLIDEKGKVEDAKVIRGPEAFRKPVLAVVFDWEFTPARHEGRPVKVWGAKEVRFRLR